VTEAIQLYRFLPHRRKVQLWALVGLMLLSAALELATLATLVPFLSAIEGKPMNGAIARALEMAGLEAQPAARVIFLIFVAVAGVSTAVRLLLGWVSTRLTHAMGADLATILVGATLNQPYRYHVEHNSSETIAGLNKVNAVLHGILTPLVQTGISIVLVLSMMAALLLINPGLTSLIFTVVPASYAAIYLASRYRLDRNSKSIAEDEQDKVQTVQEASGGIRDVILYGHQELYADRFARTEHRLRNAQAVNSFLGSAPRHVIELVGLVLISLVCYLTTAHSDNPGSLIATLGPVVLGMQRILPQVQQIYYGWASLLANRQSLVDVAAVLALPTRSTPQATPVGFAKGIELRAVSFRHPTRQADTLCSISMSIPRGSRIGIVGATGSGKSTLIDLIMGLLAPSSGEILIDGVALGSSNLDAWQQKIAHVPQDIYLSDSSIAENIALGVPPADVDSRRLAAACGAAQLQEWIAGLPHGLGTMVGEGGVRLSGGQRQRIGIARALYREAEVLILDEATSALDAQTESNLIQQLEQLSPDMTIIMIAHRQSTLRHCDSIFEVQAGRLAALPWEIFLRLAAADQGRAAAHPV
jgi:ATP-binding cassette, subfamily B, bacterial PglK